MEGVPSKNIYSYLFICREEVGLLPAQFCLPLTFMHDMFYCSRLRHPYASHSANLTDSPVHPDIACKTERRSVQQSYSSSCSSKHQERAGGGKEERREREHIPDGFLISAFGQDLIPSLSSLPLLVKPSTYHTGFLILSGDPVPRQQH